MTVSNRAGEEDVIIIAGTADARNIIEGLSAINLKIVATVTTDFGAELLEQYEGITVHKGRMDQDGMMRLFASSGAKCVVDASHPFAIEASINAMKACEQIKMPYIRFERADINSDSDYISRVEDFEEAAEAVEKMKGNILLTTGSNSLGVFTKIITDYKERLFVRVLPESGVIRKCEELGLSAKNILALRGPFSEALNLEMLKHCNAEILVTKESGEPGGTAEKIRAAEALGIKIVLISRPQIAYMNKTDNIDDVIRYVRECLYL